jgi:hypothetical protein
MLLRYSSSSLHAPVHEAFYLHIIFNLNITVMATTFEKHYIGKGTLVKDLDIIKVVIPLPFDEKAVFEKEGKQYLSFEVSRMKEPDKFGRTHTCYFQTRETGESADNNSEIQESKAEEEPVLEPEDDLPF